MIFHQLRFWWCCEKGMRSGPYTLPSGADLSLYVFSSLPLRLPLSWCDDCLSCRVRIAFSFLCVFVYCAVLACGCRDALILRSVCKQAVFRCWSSDFQCVSSVLHLFPPPLTVAGFDVVFCVWVISYLCACLCQWVFPFIIFMFVAAVFNFLLREVPLAFVTKLVLLVCRAFHFSAKSEWESCWVEYFGCSFLLFVTLNTSSTPFWSAQFLLEDKLITLWDFLVCYFIAFPFLLLIFSLRFFSLVTMCLGMFLLEFVLPEALHFLDLGDCFLSSVMKFFSYHLFRYFLRSFLSPCGPHIMRMLVDLVLSQAS